MGDRNRTGDVDVRIRGLPASDADLLTEDVCVESNRLCVDAILSGISVPAGSTLTELVPTPRNVPGNSTDAFNFVIPNGQVLTIVSLISGAETRNASDDGSKVEIYYEPDANPANDQLVTAHYVKHSTFKEPDIDFVTGVGDGVAQISIRRTRLDTGSREIFAKLRGYVT